MHNVSSNISVTQQQTVEICRLGEKSETVNPSSRSGKDVLLGLVVDLNEVL